MAYASCHRVCPMTISRLMDLQQAVDAHGSRAEFLVVGYDPEHDDPAAWRQYRKTHQLHRDNWHFLVGTRADTLRLARTLGFKYWNYDQHVIHDFRIVALNPDGSFRAAVDSADADWQKLL